MEIELLSRPATSVAKLILKSGEIVRSEVGAMIAMSAGFNVETSARKRGEGGFGASLRRMFAGESFFINEFTATSHGQELILGPQMAGDIAQHHLSQGSLIIQKSSWLASGEHIEVDASFQGLGNALFSGESMFWVKCSGNGDILLNSFGAIYEIDVDDSGYIVDTGHIVAFEDSLQFNVRKAGSSWIGSFLSGEGLVCEFTGHGKLYCQTHNLSGFGAALGAKLKPR
jgi:uncharacterized protein (TIGR00266 family)